MKDTKKKKAQAIVYRNGIPTAPDVAALCKHFPNEDMPVGRVIEQSEIAVVIGISPDTCRFKTVVWNNWNFNPTFFSKEIKMKIKDLILKLQELDPENQIVDIFDWSHHQTRFLPHYEKTQIALDILDSLFDLERGDKK